MSSGLSDAALLREKLRAEAQKLGLDLAEVMFMPAREGAPDIMQAVFVVRPEALQTAAQREQMAYDASFEKLVAGIALSDATDKAAKSISEDDAKIAAAREEALRIAQELEEELKEDD